VIPVKWLPQVLRHFVVEGLREEPFHGRPLLGLFGVIHGVGISCEALGDRYVSATVVVRISRENLFY
jgi:hypothetical protein